MNDPSNPQKAIGQMITLKNAKHLAQKAGIRASAPTIIKWIKDHNLGHQPGGHGGVWFIKKDAFIKFLQGDSNAKKN